MATQNIRTRSGNKIRVYLDGIQVGMMQNVRMSDDYAPDPASGIGDIHVQEWVPTMARYSINVTTMVLIRGALSQAGAVIPENGDEVLQGLVFDFLVIDRSTNETVKKYRGVSFASGDIEVTKHAILMQSATFNALDTKGTGQGAT